MTWYIYFSTIWYVINLYIYLLDWMVDRIIFIFLSHIVCMCMYALHCTVYQWRALHFPSSSSAMNHSHCLRRYRRKNTAWITNFFFITGEALRIGSHSLIWRATTVAWIEDPFSFGCSPSKVIWPLHHGQSFGMLLKNFWRDKKIVSDTLRYFF